MCTWSRVDRSIPRVLEASVGGHFKRRDPTVATELLRSKWVDGTSLLYVGRSANLRDRPKLLARFGHGEAVGHCGGRYLWQVADYDQLLVAWQETTDQVEREAEILEDFHTTFESLPFANIARPRAGSLSDDRFRVRLSVRVHPSLDRSLPGAGASASGHAAATGELAKLMSRARVMPGLLPGWVKRAISRLRVKQQPRP